VAANLAARYPKDFVYKQLDLFDSPTQKVHTYFKEANEFIQKALKDGPNNKVLVHW
jgi:protein-tyrosine phosphatase